MNQKLLCRKCPKLTQGERACDGIVAQASCAKVHEDRPFVVRRQRPFSPLGFSHVRIRWRFIVLLIMASLSWRRGLSLLSRPSLSRLCKSSKPGLARLVDTARAANWCYYVEWRGFLYNNRYSTSSKLTPEGEKDESLMELDPLKLPGKLSEYTGNVMYPDDESAVWDIKRE